jgi:hypothetical protein
MAESEDGHGRRQIVKEKGNTFAADLTSVSGPGSEGRRSAAEARLTGAARDGLWAVHWISKQNTTLSDCILEAVLEWCPNQQHVGWEQTGVGSSPNFAPLFASSSGPFQATAGRRF